MEQLWGALIAGATSGAVLTAILGVISLRRTEGIRHQIETHYALLQDIARSQRGWKERALSEVLGPVCIQLARTSRAFSRYRERNLYLEAKVIREGNLAVRDLLLKHPHLLPLQLLPDAGLLIEHYDRWLEEFERLRPAQQPALEAPFVFAGPAGFPFPKQAEKNFEKFYRQYWEEAYGRTEEHAARSDDRPGHEYGQKETEVCTTR